MVLFQTGNEGEYYQRAAREVVARLSDAGLIPCAWPVISCRDPDAEAEVAIQSIEDGYAGLVFEVGKQASWQYEGAVRLGERMIETELPQEVMFYSSLPDISANLDIPYAEMSRFCKGGFMPQAYASCGWAPWYTLDVVAYREFHLWAEAHEVESPIYPVLGLYRDADGQDPLTIGEMRTWFEALSRYKPTFFSIYRAAEVPEVVWPLLAEIDTTPRGRKPPPGPVIEGHYVTVRPGETVSRLCAQHGCTKEQFWSWNSHLWIALGKERDPELLQYGWIVRVQ
jgi:hypothetical protein